jgi:hypothetical protein
LLLHEKHPGQSYSLCLPRTQPEGMDTFKMLPPHWVVSSKTLFCSMAGVCSTFWSSCTPPRRTQNDSCFPVVSWRINIDLKSFLSISLEGACLHVSTFSGLLWLCVASKAEAGCLSPRSLRALILTSPWATKQKWCNAIKTASPAFKESQMLCLSTYLCQGNGEPCICVCMYTCQCMHANVCMCVCVCTQPYTNTAQNYPVYYWGPQHFWVSTK